MGVANNKGDAISLPQVEFDIQADLNETNGTAYELIIRKQILAIKQPVEVRIPTDTQFLGEHPDGFSADELVLFMTPLALELLKESKMGKVIDNGQT